jgi:putative ABC transport system permease protein
MQAPWRLAISSVFERPSRSILLALVVTLAAVLISAVGVAMGSLRAGLEARTKFMVGEADVRIQARAGRTFDASILDEARRWEGVAVAAPRLTHAIALRFGKPVWKRPDGVELGPFERSVETYQASTNVDGLDPANDALIRKQPLVEGRLPQADDEIVLDEDLVKRLGKTGSLSMLGQGGLSVFARGTGEITKADPGPSRVEDDAQATALNASAGPAVGDFVEVVRVGQPPRRLTIVGITAPPPLGGKSWSYMTIPGLSKHSALSGKLTRIEIVAREGIDPDALVATLAPNLPDTLRIESTREMLAGLGRSMRANQLGFTIGTLMAFIAAGFIITTGMSTGINERRRELAILRCIGATRRQLAAAQVLQGLVIGLAGALVGVPIGVAAAYLLLQHYEQRLQAPPVILPDRVAISFLGAIFAGVVGAALPAWQAARVSPLQALASRGRAANPRFLTLVALAGLAGVLIHLGIFTLLKSPEVVFFSYVSLGLPALMLGYFLLGVPAVLLVSRVGAPLLERLLRLPPRMLARSLSKTPYRFGFTAGAMMAGLALMVAIWTQGGAAVRDWLERIRFPDAFVIGVGMNDDVIAAANELDVVVDTCAISLHPVTTQAFGVKGITKVKTFFVAFEPETFFRMSSMEWIQGDEPTARARLEAGGAVIVSREFLVARGMGVGSTFTCADDDGNEHAFDVVGVVASPGLEVANNFFDIGEDFSEQRVHAVFGSRKDLLERFGSDNVGMLQLDLRDDIDTDAEDDAAMTQVRAALLPYGVLSAGSGRQIREAITSVVRTTLVISSAVAIFAMLVACFGVANLVIAGVHARQFEFGVLRAVGGTRGQLARLVLGEAIVIAIAACVLGTLMGIQGAFGGITLNALIWGIDLALRPPVTAIALGWGFVGVMCVGAAAPAAIALARRTPRELLSATRG